MNPTAPGQPIPYPLWPQAGAPSVNGADQQLALERTMVEVLDSLQQVLARLQATLSVETGLSLDALATAAGQNAATAVLASMDAAMASLDADSLQVVGTLFPALIARVEAVRDRLPAALVGGRLAVETGLSIPVPQTDALTDAQLRSSPPAVRDDYSGDVITADQLGSDEALDFDTGPLFLVAVDVDPVDADDEASYLCRATVDGSAPTASQGWRCRSGQTTYLPVPCPGGTVRVWAPEGVSVSVQGGVRA